jgi:hypothetical protein
MTRSGQTGMICEVSDPDGVSATHPVTQRGSARTVGRRGRSSPWLWGLVALLVIGAIAATQVPRVSRVFSAPHAKPSAAATRGPTLSGPVYSQAMVANRNFIGADLRGARLANLDLRGTDFRRADAAGAIFTGSLLNGTNFSRADLRGADLSRTCLRGSILSSAQLAGANFTGADVTGATITPAITADAIGWQSAPSSSVCSRG